MTTTKILGYLNFSRAIENYIWIAQRAIDEKKWTHRLYIPRVDLSERAASSGSQSESSLSLKTREENRINCWLWGGHNYLKI